MKKKNIFKKLLSVVLSAATMFSLLTLPAQAIIPGEDAYGGESYAVRYNVATATKTTVNIPNYNDMYAGMSTHAFLKEPVEEYSDDAMLPNVIIGGDDRTQVSPTGGPFSGIVLLETTTIDSEGNIHDYTSTGFLVAPRVVVTAAHCLLPSPKQDTGEIETFLYAKIYHGVSVSAAASPSYEGYPSADIIDFFFSPTYDDIRVGNISGSKYNYDWAVAILDEPIDGYYFDCVCTTDAESLEGQLMSIAGYPWDRAYFMNLAMGTISSALNEYCVLHTIDAVGGQSGSPMYQNSLTLGRKCYGIFTTEWAYGINISTLFTAEAYNTIVDVMQMVD